MQRFKEFLNEHVLSIGLNPSHEKHREKHRQEFHDMIHHAYKDIGGYSGHKSGSKEESDAIHKDITHSMIKAVKRNNKITAVNLYKNDHGRKSIASASDGTEQGKKDYIKNKKEDHHDKRSWAEVSGKVKHLHNKIGTPEIPYEKAKKLIKKDMKPTTGNSYTRSIGGKDHEKTAVGYPKDKK
jgi:hypothetical protein